MSLVSWRLFVISAACVFLLAPSAETSKSKQIKTPAWLELKFQTEIENSTIIKRPGQVQTFKCQVRLAPAAVASNKPHQPLKTNVYLAPQTVESELPQSGKWPANVSIQIDWLKDGKQLVQSSDEPVTVSLLEFVQKSPPKGNSQTGQDKKNKPRIEIKNTLNSGQFKLASRLRLSQLRLTDSGQYKCVARASFQVLSSPSLLSSTSTGVQSNFGGGGVGNPIGGTSNLAPSNSIESTRGARTSQEGASNADQAANFDISAPSTGKQVLLVEQALESSTSAELFVSNSSGSASSASFADGKDSATLDLIRAGSKQQQPSDTKWRQGSHQAKQAIPQTPLQFEDDEDLYRLEQRDFISGFSGSSASGPSNNNTQEPLDDFGSSSSSSDRFNFGEDLPVVAVAANTNDDPSYPTHSNDVHGDNPSSYLDSTKSKLSRFVHNIAPELGCYTGLGEHYNGNISRSFDGLSCQNWLHIKQSLLGQSAGISGPTTLRDIYFMTKAYENHNYCRNPNLDTRGPWCYVAVQYSQVPPESLDGFRHDTASSASLVEHLVRRRCALSPCSEYLWVYIVAPPFGLLLFVSILVGFVARSARSSRSSRDRLGKIFRAKKCFNPKRFTQSDKKGAQDDIFEIVDDIDWSEGGNQINQTQSLSPRSTNESLKLSFSSQSSATGSDQRLISCKSNNQIFLQQSDQQVKRPSARSAITSQGPMFATLRCHIREAGHRLNSNHSSSSFIEPSSHVEHHSKQRGAPPLGHLISCSTTADDIQADTFGDQIVASCLTKLDAASIHPQLASSSSTSANQPLFEGKFNQVQMAYIKSKQQLDAVGHLGSQVAVLSLKQQQQVELTSLFHASQLRVRNLNHLNLLKLIGYFGGDDDNQQEIGSTCSSLVFDMSQLVDLPDWLKDQSKDGDLLLNADEDLSLRRNLTCIVKQVALAIDYLHDKNVIFRDLACRHCFLDPTKMLVKLASFNLELVLDEVNCDEGHPLEDAMQNMKSMIRPKYLFDYYVIDSRPLNCQLLPLSWIPLESILFNKFNKQTDVWSFGCLIYEIFSLGEVAYFGYSSKQIIDAVRSNLMPPKPILCQPGVYKLMCKCLNDIPTIRPNVKQIYEQLNLYSGQCSSFLDHHLCSLSPSVFRDDTPCGVQMHQVEASIGPNSYNNVCNSITKTKSYANFVQNSQEIATSAIVGGQSRQLDATGRIPLSKSINLTAATNSRFNLNQVRDGNHYDEPIVNGTTNNHNES